MPNELNKLEEQVEQLKEDLFLCQQDEERWRTENISLRNFIQTLYENCEGLEKTELTLDAVLKNLRENIKVFARDHKIRL